MSFEFNIVIRNDLMYVEHQCNTVLFLRVYVPTELYHSTENTNSRFNSMGWK